MGGKAEPFVRKIDLSSRVTKGNDGRTHQVVNNICEDEEEDEFMYSNMIQTKDDRKADQDNK